MYIQMLGPYPSPGHGDSGMEESLPSSGPKSREVGISLVASAPQEWGASLSTFSEPKEMVKEGPPGVLRQMGPRVALKRAPVSLWAWEAS